MFRKKKKVEKEEQPEVVELIHIDTLHKAVLYNKRTRLIQLLEKGEFVDKRDRHGRTALHLAVISQNVEMVKLLIAHGADVNARVYENCREEIAISDYTQPIKGYTPLQLAVMKEYKQIEISALLINSETIDFDIKLSFDYYGRTGIPIVDYLHEREHFRVLEMVEKKIRDQKNLLKKTAHPEENAPTTVKVPTEREHNTQSTSSLTLFGKGP